MTTSNIVTVKAEIGRDGEPTGIVAVVKVETGVQFKPTANVAVVKAEVGKQPNPIARVPTLKIEVGYGIKPFVPAWPLDVVAQASAQMIAAGPIAATLFYPPYIEQTTLTISGSAAVAFGGIGATQGQGTFDTRTFSVFTAITIPPSSFNMSGAATMLVTAVRTGSTFEIAGAANFDARAIAAAPMTFAFTGGSTAGFIAPALATLIVSGEAVMRTYGMAAIPARLTSVATASVGFVGLGSGIGALTANGSSAASFAGHSLAQTYWRSDAYAVANFTPSRAVAARLVSAGVANAFFANGSAKPTTLSVAAGSSASFAGNALSYEFGFNGSSTTVFYGTGSGLGAFAITGAADVEFDGTTTSQAFTMSGAATAAFVGALALDGAFAITGTATVGFDSNAPGLGVLHSTGAASVAFVAGQPIRAGVFSSVGSSTAAFFTSNQFTILGASQVIFASDLSWLANFSSTGLATANFDSQGAVTSVFTMQGGSTFTAVPDVRLVAVGGSTFDFKGAQPAAGTLNASGGATVVMVGSGLIKAAAAMLGASTAAFDGAGATQAGISITGASDVEFAGLGLANAVTHFDGASAASFQGRGLALGRMSSTGLSGATWASSGRAAGALASSGAAGVNFLGVGEAGGSFASNGAAAVNWGSNLEIGGALTATGGCGVQFHGTGVVYSQFYMTGKATFAAIVGETVNAAMSSVGSADVEFGSSAIKRSVMTAVGYSVVIGYSQESVVLNPGRVIVEFSVPDTQVIWSDTANTDVEFTQQALVGGGVTRQADMTVKWEL